MPGEGVSERRNLSSGQYITESTVLLITRSVLYCVILICKHDQAKDKDDRSDVCSNCDPGIKNMAVVYTGNTNMFFLIIRRIIANVFIKMASASLLNEI